MREIRRVVLHCSASDFGTVPMITGWHEERGWSTIGYHYVITNGYQTYDDVILDRRIAPLNGSIQAGRPEADVGAHCGGHNTDSIGVCLIGTGEFTPHQWKGLFELCDNLAERHGLDADSFIGHRELNPGKTCPNFDPDLFRICLKDPGQRKMFLETEWVVWFNASKK